MSEEQQRAEDNAQKVAENLERKEGAEQSPGSAEQGERRAKGMEGAQESK